MNWFQFILRFSSCLVIFASVAAHGGGEIGNGFVNYSNLLGGYSLSYPESWSYSSLDKIVSFTDHPELQPGSKDAAILNVTSKRFAQIKNINDLYEQIQIFHLNEKWERIRIANRDGFQSIKDNNGIIYLLQSPENVISVRFNMGEQEEAHKVIREMISSLSIN